MTNKPKLKNMVIYFQIVKQRTQDEGPPTTWDKNNIAFYIQ
jgi:hypothetical protein